MNKQVSTSASQTRKVNDRVVVRANKNEWYTGRVTRVRPKTVSVKFDDGLIATIDEEDFEHVKLMLLDYKSDDPLTDADAEKLYQKAKQASVKQKVKVALAPKEPKSDMDLTDPWAQQLLRHLAPDLYARAHKSRNPRLMSAWLEHQYTMMNREYFNNELPRPVLAIMTIGEEHKLKCYGLWKATQRHLLLGQSLFDMIEFDVLRSLLHEMCHQAVSEIDRLVGVGHSEAWHRWMHRVRMPVFLQTDLTHDVPAMLKFEPDDAADLPTITSVSDKPVPPPIDKEVNKYESFTDAPLVATPAFLRSSSGMLRKGVVLGQWRRGIEQVWFLTTPSLDTVKLVYLRDLQKIPMEERAPFRTPAWLASIARCTADKKLKPRIFNIHGLVNCAICGKTVDTTVEPALSIDRQKYDLPHAAEHLGMSEALLREMLVKNQLTET